MTSLIIQAAQKSLVDRQKMLDKVQYSKVKKFVYSKGALLVPWVMRSREPKKWLIERLPDCEGKRCLYKISLKDRSRHAELKKKFEMASGDKNRGYSLPQLNLDDWSLSEVIYVGTSKSVYSRLKEHLSFASAKTFALNLGKWVNDDNIEFVVEVFYIEGTDVELIHTDIEDALWETSKPCLGNKGGK